MPITDSNDNVVGVAQIINKLKGERDNIASHMFTEQDTLIFRKYLMFCGIGITNAQLFQLSIQEYKCNRVSCYPSLPHRTLLLGTPCEGSSHTGTHPS